MLLDAWIKRHHGAHYDRDGAWAASGSVHPDLLTALMRHAYLPLPPPKSAGREQFNLDWLDASLGSLGKALAPPDVQATLLEFTAPCLADAVIRECVGSLYLFFCGGGANICCLMQLFCAHLPGIR